MTVMQSPSKQSSFKHALCDERVPPAAYSSVATNRPPGFKSARIGVRELMRIEIVDRKRNASFASNGEKMQHGVGRAARGRNACDGVFDGRFGENF